MRACIAALSQCIPTMGVAYSKKSVGVVETVGMVDEIFDRRAFDVEESLRMTMDVFERRESNRQIILPTVKEAQALQSSLFDEIVRECARSNKGSVSK